MIRRIIYTLILLAGIGAAAAQDESDYVCLWLLTPTTMDFSVWGADEQIEQPAHEVLYMLVVAVHGEDPLLWDYTTYQFMRNITEAVHECEELFPESDMQPVPETAGG